MAYQILNPESMAKYKPTDYYRNQGGVFLNEGVNPVAGTTKMVNLATVAKSPTERMQVVAGTPQAQQAFSQGYQLEQKIPNPASIPSFTQTYKSKNALFGIPRNLTSQDLSGQAASELEQAKAQNQDVVQQNSTSDIQNFQTAINDIYSSIKSERAGLADLYKPSQQETELGNKLMDVQKAGTDWSMQTQQMQSAQDFNPNLLTSQVGKSQAQIERERSFKSQEYKLEEANLINRLGLAQDARKAEIEGRKFGLQSLLDDANLAFKVQERVDQQKQLAFQQAQTLQGAALQKATLAMNAFKEGLVNGQDATALKSSLGLLLNQAGIDPAISKSMFDAIQSGVQFDRLQSQAKLQLDRAKFSSDQAYREAQLALEAAKTQKPLTIAEQLKLKEAGYTVDDNGNIVKAPSSDVEAQNAREVISTIDGLLGPNSELNKAVGGLDQFKPDSMIGNFKAEFDQLQAKLAFANLDKLKGPMSDKDIQFLKDSSSGLNRAMSQDAFRNKLEKIRERFNVILLKPGELQKNVKAGDNTYSYRNLDGTVHTGTLGDKYIDKTLPKDLDLSGLGFSNVGGDTYKATNYLANYRGVTGEGSNYWKWGLDVDLKKGDPVFSPVEGQIISAGNAGGFGNRVGIRTKQGNIVYLSHNDAINVKVGDTVKPGQVVALGGNSGSTYSTTGGDGSHLDITVKKPDGSYFTPQEIRKILA